MREFLYWLRPGDPSDERERSRTKRHLLGLSLPPGELEALLEDYIVELDESTESALIAGLLHSSFPMRLFCARALSNFNWLPTNTQQKLDQAIAIRDWQSLWSLIDSHQQDLSYTFVNLSKLDPKVTDPDYDRRIRTSNGVVGISVLRRDVADLPLPDGAGVMLGETAPERIARGDLRMPQAAIRAIIRYGLNGSEDQLCSFLFERGHIEMADDFLNSGHEILEKAARTWAAQNNCRIVSRPADAATVRWGSRGKFA